MQQEFFMDFFLQTCITWKPSANFASIVLYIFLPVLVTDQIWCFCLPVLVTVTVLGLVFLSDQVNTLVIVGLNRTITEM